MTTTELKQQYSEAQTNFSHATTEAERRRWEKELDRLDLAMARTREEHKEAAVAHKARATALEHTNPEAAELHRDAASEHSIASDRGVSATNASPRAQRLSIAAYAAEARKTR